MKITLSYQPQLLSPPYAYAAVLKFDSSGDEIETEFEIAYLNRDLISIDAIKSEGFTENDDYSWKGDFNPNWKKDIESFARLKSMEDPDAEIYLHISVNDSELGFPKEIKKADKLFQELMQAIVERDQLELPLQLDLKLDGQPVQIKWRFWERMVLVNDNQSIDWEAGRNMMELIYSINFELIKPSKKSVKNCVNLEGVWYPIKDNVAQTLIGQMAQL
ncbi:hypothetical protein [Ekhidna sp.]|uniref:hypothetical protein n=1 Tax=Ekhidna sp. TaxID=2608089 RepID=UPI00329A3175